MSVSSISSSDIASVVTLWIRPSTLATNQTLATLWPTVSPAAWSPWKV